MSLQKLVMTALAVGSVIAAPTSAGALAPQAAGRAVATYCPRHRWQGGPNDRCPGCTAELAPRTSGATGGGSSFASQLQAEAAQRMINGIMGSLFSGPDPAAAERARRLRAEEARQRAEAERLRQAQLKKERFESAARQRASWEKQDLGIQETLGEILGGAAGGVVDLRPSGDPGSQEEAWTDASVVDLRGIPDSRLRMEALLRQTEPTDRRANLPIAYFGKNVPSPSPPDRLSLVPDDLIDELCEQGREWVLEKVDARSAAFAHARRLYGEFKELYDPLRAEVEKTINLHQEGMTSAAEILGSRRLTDGGWGEEYDRRVQERTSELKDVSRQLAAEQAIGKVLDVDEEEPADLAPLVVPIENPPAYGGLNTGFRISGDFGPARGGWGRAWAILVGEP